MVEMHGWGGSFKIGLLNELGWGWALLYNGVGYR
jgi:hypothetical protein